MKRVGSIIALTLFCHLHADDSKIGVVDFRRCVLESELGKREQEAFESMRLELSNLMLDTGKQIEEIEKKLEDADYMDTINSEEEKRLKENIAQLNEEMNRYNQQYYQFLNQGSNRVIQSIAKNVNSASEKYARQKGFSLVLNSEVLFYSSPSLDITQHIISEMDKDLDLENKKQSTPSQENR